MCGRACCVSPCVHQPLSAAAPCRLIKRCTTTSLRFWAAQRAQGAPTEASKRAVYARAVPKAQQMLRDIAVQHSVGDEELSAWFESVSLCTDGSHVHGLLPPHYTCDPGCRLAILTLWSWAQAMRPTRKRRVVAEPAVQLRCGARLALA